MFKGFFFFNTLALRNIFGRFKQFLCLAFISKYIFDPLEMAGKSFHLVSQIYQIQTEDIHIKVFRPNEGLTLETSSIETLYGGQFTLSTQLI